MKIFYTAAVLVLVLVASVKGQAPEWEWARGAAGNGAGYGISTDAHGNSYVAGDGEIVTSSNDTLTNGNAFIAKYDELGNVLWAKSGTGTFSGWGTVAIDAYDNVYSAGSYASDTVTFGNYVLTGGCIYIVKYDSSGNVIWANNIAGDPYNRTSGISADAMGNIYITGTYKSLIIGNDTLIFAGSQSLFLVKYGATGNFSWVKTFGEMYDDEINGVTTDNKENVYVTGSFTDSALIFGNDTLMNINLDSAYEFYLVKYDSAGNVIWAKSAGGSSGCEGAGVSVDTTGNIYITGGFTGPNIVFGSTSLFSMNNPTIFILKYDTAGKVLWGETAGGGEIDETSGITTDIDGNVYIKGDFAGGYIYFGGILLHTPSFENVFVAKYNSLGSPLWAKTVSANGDDIVGYINGISTDAKDNVYVTGFGWEPVVFDSDSLGIQSNNPNYDFYFTAKLVNDSITALPTLSPPAHLITVYPNPTTGMVYFSGAPSGCTLQVYNVLGEVISSSIIDRDNYSINLTGKAKGIYFYRITGADNGVQQGKVVVE